MENFFHHINNLYQNIKFTTEEETNGKLVFHDSLLKQNNLKMSVLVYRKPAHTDHTTALTTKQVSRKVLFNRVYSTVTNEDDLTKEKTLEKSKC